MRFCVLATLSNGCGLSSLPSATFPLGQLASHIATEVVEPLEMGESFVNETFEMCLDSPRLYERDLMGVGSLNSLLEIVKERDQK